MFEWAHSVWGTHVPFYFTFLSWYDYHPPPTPRIDFLCKRTCTWSSTCSRALSSSWTHSPPHTAPSTIFVVHSIVVVSLEEPPPTVTESPYNLQNHPLHHYLQCLVNPQIDPDLLCSISLPSQRSLRMEFLVYGPWWHTAKQCRTLQESFIIPLPSYRILHVSMIQIHIVSFLIRRTNIIPLTIA